MAGRSCWKSRARTRHRIVPSGRRWKHGLAPSMPRVGSASGAAMSRISLRSFMMSCCDTAEMSGPLAHLTILDLSRVLAGPWCTQLLADLGATVIKIEKPGSGDDTRAWGPPFLRDTAGNDTAEAAYYLACNRGKQSVAIDFT